MPAEIRIYFEGHKLLKPGFDGFFRALRERAREQRCGYRLISAKSGEQARQDFETALQTHPKAWSILLRDSEGPLQRNQAGAHKYRVFWMVEMMEAWFHADKEALAKFYGRGFKKTVLKPNPKVEQISKADLEVGLHSATRNTTKGEYSKTSHGPKLLALIDPTLVRQAAPNCDRLFQAVLAHLR